MTRQWRVRAAERPARRRANPPSPTKYRLPNRAVGIFLRICQVTAGQIMRCGQA